ncbi:hypothetical protein BDP55DRAFT_213999 [Colletotrichum godetiae]|uniref:Uncharacterized protein n=1 Tax=Colletotrichum godetiae TaxID=1209918 RepID=A0AAJ0F415_9PEZI|nr:uncharacterized protein BDP55DRAFT_213999 [Colletotrichum godetiae]KAK1700006.1 hypothetical protein BDP55DRAFT_213999 [Colletotrichum godetiae]
MWSGGVDNGIGGRERRGVCVGSGRCAQKRKGRANMRGVKGGVRGREGRRTWKRPGRIGGGGGTWTWTWDLTRGPCQVKKGRDWREKAREPSGSGKKDCRKPKGDGRTVRTRRGTGKGKPKAKAERQEIFCGAGLEISSRCTRTNFFGRSKEQRDGAATAKLKVELEPEESRLEGEDPPSPAPLEGFQPAGIGWKVRRNT